MLFGARLTEQAGGGQKLFWPCPKTRTIFKKGASLCGSYHKHNCIIVIVSIIHHHHFKQLPRAIWFCFSTSHMYIAKSFRHRSSTKGSGGQDTTILFTYDQDIMNCKKQDALKKKAAKLLSKPPSRRHRPLVHGGNQRLHASPTASDSRAGEGGERNLFVRIFKGKFSK